MITAMTHVSMNCPFHEQHLDTHGASVKTAGTTRSEATKAARIVAA
jgi:hypothetical protein